MGIGGDSAFGRWWRSPWRSVATFALGIAAGFGVSRLTAPNPPVPTLAEVLGAGLGSVRAKAKGDAGPGPAPESAIPEADRPRLRPGDRVTLASDVQDPFPVANFLIRYHEYDQTMTAGDWAGFAGLRKEGAIAMVPNGTRALVLHIYPAGYPADHPVALVRIAGGERDGKEAYLPAYYAKAESGATR